MVNTEDFIKRLEIILDYYSLNASSFADKIGVQRSSLSHLLSGRNKPSLDFILKILEVFPEVDLYWILNGTGTFPIETEKTNTQKIATPTPFVEQPVADNLFSEITKPQEGKKMEQQLATLPIANVGELEKIVFFYKNGTFKIYNPNF
jgi:transcriptional regulator with XRE-family HTH domain